MQYLLTALTLTLTSAPAAGTGRITGRVVDADTRSPVVGAAVEVDGADLGAATDENGHYLIASVPTGTYTVVVFAMGYHPGRKTGVVVSADQAVTADFRLKTTAILIDRGPPPGYTSPIFRHDVAQTERILESGALNVLPLSKVGELLALMPGVTSGREVTDLHVRGGRKDDVNYFVNGAGARCPDRGTLGRAGPPGDGHTGVASGGRRNERRVRRCDVRRS
jgi:hypothetical protein